MIVTLTANPSIDRTLQLAAPLRVGDVQRAVTVVDQAGGKGINVTRAATSAGRSSVAIFPSPPDDSFVSLLSHGGVPARAVPCRARVRTNVTVVDPAGVTTKLNEPGTAPGQEAQAALTAALHEACVGARWAVLAGSLPAGVSDSWYADLVGTLVDTGVRIAVDTSGAPLLACASAPVRPHLLKPNGPELAELVGSDADLEADVDAAAAAASSLVRSGVDALLVTLGSAGALLATADGVWRARTTAPVTVRSTVGAGDSTLSGYLLADLDGLDPGDRLRRAVAYGTAAVQLPGSTIPTPADAHEEAVTITDMR